MADEQREEVYETEDLPECEQTAVDEQFDSPDIDGTRNDVVGAYSLFKGRETSDLDAYLARRRQRGYASTGGNGYCIELLGVQDAFVETPKQKFERLLKECSELSEMVAKSKTSEGVDTDVTASDLTMLETQLNKLQVEHIVRQPTHVNMADPHNALLAKLNTSIGAAKAASAKGASTGVVYEVYAGGVECTQNVAAVEARLHALERTIGACTSPVVDQLAVMSERLRLLDVGTIDGVDDKLRAVLKHVNELNEKDTSESDNAQKIDELHAMLVKWEGVCSSLPALSQRLLALQQLHEQSMHTAQALTSVDGAQQAMSRSLLTSNELLAEVRASLTTNMTDIRANMAELDKRVKACK